MQETVAQMLASLALLCFSVLLGLVSVGFLVAGLYLWLETQLDPAAAATITGAVLLALTIIMLMVCKSVASPRKRLVDTGHEKAPEDDLSALLNDVTNLRKASKHAEAVIREHFPVAAASTFTLGFYLGVSPDARRQLSDLVTELMKHKGS